MLVALFVNSSKEGVVRYYSRGKENLYCSTSGDVSIQVKRDLNPKREGERG